MSLVMTRRHVRVGAFSLLVLGLVALSCDSRTERTSRSQQAQPAAPPRTLAMRKTTPTTRETTPPTVVRGNLDNRIRVRRRRFEAGKATHRDMGTLAVELLRRAQFFGMVSDYGRAVIVTDRLVELDPSKDSLLLRARARAAVHDWQEAQLSLEAARSAGADTGETADLEADLATARGHRDKALALRQTQASRRPNTTTLGALAVSLASIGDIDGAELRFEAARRAYADASPLPLVWLLFQNGVMWEGAGNPDKAAALYRKALERLPLYAAAAGRLAEHHARSGDIEAAIALLEPVIESSDDPAYLAQLGRLLRWRGAVADGDALVERARAGYERLLVAHPAAFADQAIVFFLGPGRDPMRAMQLAADSSGHGHSHGHSHGHH